MEKNTKTILVSLHGAPGSGKSTLAALIFSKLKLLGINSENVFEYPKKLVWSKRKFCLNFQPLIFGKQLYAIESLQNQVDVILCDSPPILSALYCGEAYPESFKTAVIDIYKAIPNRIDYFVRRTKPYNPSGRTQSEEESVELGKNMVDFLDKAGINYEITESSEVAATSIVNKILGQLHPKENDSDFIGVTSGGELIYLKDIILDGKDYPLDGPDSMFVYSVSELKNYQYVITSLDGELE